MEAKVVIKLIDWTLSLISVLQAHNANLAPVRALIELSESEGRPISDTERQGLIDDMMATGTAVREQVNS